MKVKLIFASMLAMSLASCNNDNEPTTPADGEIAAKIVADIDHVATRASGDSWAGNDRIGVSTLPGTRTDYTNIPYKWDGTKFDADGNTIYFQSAEPVTFRAYYPFAGTSGTSAGVISAVTDAQAQKDLPAIDFLFASGATTDKTSPTVKFTGSASFGHRMSQVTLTFEEGNGVELTGKLTGYSLNGLILKGGFHTEDGVAQASAGESAVNLAITPENVTVTNKKYTAAPVILFPQEVTDGKIVLEVTVDGNTYKATLILPDADEDGTPDTALKAGYNYTYSVRVNKTELEIGNAEISPWNEVAGGSGDAVMQ